MFSDLHYRWRALFRRRQVDAELDDELQDHIAHQTAKNIGLGLPTEEARRRALFALGGLEQTRQQVREARGTGMIEHLLQDLRYGFRSLARDRGFAGVYIVTLGLGIGSCTAIFSLMTAVMFPPLPYGDPGRLAYITTPNRSLGEVPPEMVLPDNADFTDMKRASHSFSAMTEFTQRRLMLDQPGMELGGAAVDGEFFSTLEVAPALGRVINAEDNQPGNDGVAVISHSAWQQFFDLDPAVLSRSLHLNGRSYRIVGVMPAGFNYPHKTDLNGGNSHLEATDVWIPLALTASQRADRGLSGDNYALGRLRQRVTAPQAAAELSAILRPLDPLHDASTFRQGWYAYITTFRQTLEGSARPLLLLLMGAVSFVLVIACGNAAGLLVARSANRTHELGVRATLGAGRGRLIRQMLTEALLLGAGGGLAGIGLAWSFLRLLLMLDPGDIPRLHQAALNGRVLAFAVGATLLTSVLTGTLPALWASRVNLIEFLKSGGQTGAKGARSRFRSALIGAQVAIVVVLLAGAGLLMKSLVKLQQVPLGFSSRTLSLKLNLPDHDRNGEQREAFYRTLVAQIQSMSGTLAAGATDNLPFGDTEGVGNFWVEDYPNQEGQMTDGGDATPDYFSAMETPLLQGRMFTAGDTSASPAPVIINQAFARKFFAGRDPLGKRILSNNPAVSPQALKHPRVVVGVVADMRDWTLEAQPQPQLFNLLRSPDDAYIVIRSTLPRADVLQSASAILHRLDGSLAFTKVHTMHELVSEAAARPRFQAVLLAIFAGMATALALVGFYGLLAYTASRRGPEMGIRIALGATRAHILRLFLAQGLRIVGVGLLCGLGAALACTRLLASSLYQVRPWDPPTFGLVAALFLVAALIASVVPAQRAAHSDPMIMLRRE